jgi:hypothetical protein
LIASVEVRLHGLGGERYACGETEDNSDEENADFFHTASSVSLASNPYARETEF